jgi:hypothetical protein
MSKTQFRQEASARHQAQLASELYDAEMLISSIRRYVELLGSGEQVDCFKNYRGLGPWRPHMEAARRLLGVWITKDPVLDKCWHRLPEGFEKKIQERLGVDITQASFHKLNSEGEINDTLRHYVAAIGGEIAAGEDHPIIVRAKQFLLEPAARIAARKAKTDNQAPPIVI